MPVPKDASPYKASLTRRQFLFHEMRVTARLMALGLSDQEIVKQIMNDNLFQYPTEKSIRDLSAVCIQRLRALDESLVHAVAESSSEVAKQICLYAMMKQSRLVLDFMVGVIGEKFRQHDLSFGKIDINSFFFRLQEQDSVVATWSDSTISKLKQVLLNILGCLFELFGFVIFSNERFDNSDSAYVFAYGSVQIIIQSEYLCKNRESEFCNSEYQ